MSLYKRNGSAHYWVGFTVNGKRFQKSTGTSDKEEALRIHAHIESEIRDQARFGAKPDPIWEEVAALWLAEREDKPGYANYIGYLAWFQPHLSGKRLSKIDRFLIEQMTLELKKGRKPATVKCYLECLSGVLRYAYEREWLERMPKIKHPTVANKRVRWLTREEFERLAAAMPVYMEPVARFSVATGLRLMNACNLRWDQVDMQNHVVWIEADEIKTKKPLPVPLNDEAVAVIRRQLGRHQERVFTRDGAPIKKIWYRAFQAAVKAAGLADLRWHDLRHTWATWHKQAGTDESTLMEMGGWSSMEMLRRYAHISLAYKHEAANRIVTVPLHPVKDSDKKQGGNG